MSVFDREFPEKNKPKKKKKGSNLPKIYKYKNPHVFVGKASKSDPSPLFFRSPNGIS